jgi:hypothetical protein
MPWTPTCNWTLAAFIIGVDDHLTMPMLWRRDEDGVEILWFQHLVVIPELCYLLGSLGKNVANAADFDIVRHPHFDQRPHVGIRLNTASDHANSNLVVRADDLPITAGRYRGEGSGPGEKRLRVIFKF